MNIVKRLREFGLGEKEKTTYEEVIEFLEIHEGKIMRGSFRKNGKQINREQMTKEKQEEIKLYTRWNNCEEKKILEEYAGEPIENVPEEYREKIARLREYGLGTKVKTTYEKVIEFLEAHEGKIMRSAISKNGKPIKIEQMTEEEQEEVRLYARWNNCEEKKILEEYAGHSIENVPEEYREKINK